MIVTKRNARVVGNLEVYGTVQDNGSCIYDTMGAYIMTATPAIYHQQTLCSIVSS